MKTKKHLLRTWVLTACATCNVVNAWAQEKEEQDPPLTYGYNHTIELSMGTGRNLKSYSQLPDQGIALFGHDTWGLDIDFRYSYFFSRHWGAYVQLEALNLGTYSDAMEPALSRHYNLEDKEVRINDDCNIGYDIGSAYGMYLLGCVYRYDIGRWSFRPRLGMGVIRQRDEIALYDVVDTKTYHNIERVELYTTQHNGKCRDRYSAFAYTPSLQVTISPRRHFFFSAEVQWTGTIGHLYQRTIANEYYAEEPLDEKPDEWGYYHNNSHLEFVKKTDDHMDRLQMGNFLHFRLGVGWNIGHNRNENRRD